VNRSTDDHRHFARVASVYGRVRNTDSDVVEAIVPRLPRRTNHLEIADIGCGTGRYSLVLAQSLPGDWRMWCCDFSREMLRECWTRMGRYLPKALFSCTRVSADNLPFSDSSLDAVCTFNAVHHFNLERFVVEATRTLAPGGLLAIYTRTPEQNARNIWGRYFPGFTHYEARLFPRERLEQAVLAAEALMLEEIQEFAYNRVESIASLLGRACRFHYSTFALYPPEEYQRSLAIFAERLAALGNGPIEHSAENTLVLARRRDDPAFTT